MTSIGRWVTGSDRARCNNGIDHFHNLNWKHRTYIDPSGVNYFNGDRSHFVVIIIVVIIIILFRSNCVESPWSASHPAAIWRRQVQAEIPTVQSDSINGRMSAFIALPPPSLPTTSSISFESRAPPAAVAQTKADR